MFITLMVLCSTLMQVERECSDVNFPCLSPDCPRTIYTSHLLHMLLFFLFPYIAPMEIMFCVFFNLSRALLLRQHLFAPNAAVNQHMFCLLPFLEEPLVICRELLLSCKSNFIPLDKMSLVFCVCTCV